MVALTFHSKQIRRRRWSESCVEDLTDRIKTIENRKYKYDIFCFVIIKGKYKYLYRITYLFVFGFLSVLARCR